MKTKKSKVSIILFAVAVLFATIACGLTRPTLRVGDLRTESESVELGDADSVEVEIFMAAGQLEVSGGANELLQADFTYNVDELKPEVDYRGDALTIRTPDVNGRVDSWWDVDDYRYEWDLRLNDDVPMEMNVKVGAGKADLELGSLSLTKLDVETGAGDITLDLSGSSSLTRLDVEVGAGQVTVDLTGNWQDDLDANISGGLGELTLRLPGSACVRVAIQAGLGNVDAQGLTRDGNDYVNDACSESDVTLRIDIKAGLGNINLDAGE